MKPQPEFVLGFVGHRHLPDEEGLRPAIRLCLERFAEEAARRGGRLNVYCSISFGADLLLIECAHELAVPVHLLLAKPLPTSLEEVPTDGISADFKGGATGSGIGGGPGWRSSGPWTVCTVVPGGS